MKQHREQRAAPVRKVYFVEDLGEVLQVGRTTVYKWLREGHLLDPIRQGTGSERKRWGVDEVHEWVSAGMPTAVAWRRMRARRKRA